VNIANSQQAIAGGQEKEHSTRTADFKLYVITNRKLFSTLCSLYMAIESVLDAGAPIIQLREKDLPVRELLDMALWMRELTREYGAKLIINDRVDIALAAEADGVHLGKNSIPAYAVKKRWGDKLLIGVSTHSIEEALEAERDGADFITLGPIYETPSKLKYGRPLGADILRDARNRISLPVFAIGGIKPDRIKEVTEAGAVGVAVISAILEANNIKRTTEEFLGLLK
jgi:thiamine-phosphate pyrophosphorylase